MAALAAAVFALCCAVADAAERPRWFDEEYGHFARRESLRDLLYDFASTVSVPAIISPRINRSVSGNFQLTTALEFLSEIAGIYELAWVYDGVTLHVYSVEETERQTLDLSYTLMGEFRSWMEDLDIQGSPLRWKVVPAQNVVEVAGPPRFVELVADVVARVIAQSGEAEAGEAEAGKSEAGKSEVGKTEAGKTEVGEVHAAEADDSAYVVRIFRLEYRDVSGASGGGTPGVDLAQMLGNIMSVDHIANVVPVDGGGARKLRGTGLVPGVEDEAKEDAPAPAAPERKSQAYIASDPRLNAVVVRDLAERMPVYEELIRELDTPLDQIEIQVTLLDISQSDAESLGFDWQIDARSGDLAVSLVGGPVELALDSADAQEVVLQVSALEESGTSRVVSRPSVLTLDHHEALFQNDQTFYVRLGSERSDAVDLVPVSYGTVLKVRPHVVREDDGRKIHLVIHVEDGARTKASASVTEVPEVARTLIQTQAVIDEGQSLLIGGYNIRERSEGRRRLPLLGDIPLLGVLFSRKDTNETVFDRYFVITPTIVDTSIDYEIDTHFDDARDWQKVLHAVPAALRWGALRMPSQAQAQPALRTPASSTTRAQPTEIREPGSTPAAPGADPEVGANGVHAAAGSGESNDRRPADDGEGVTDADADAADRREPSETDPHGGPDEMAGSSHDEVADGADSAGTDSAGRVDAPPESAPPSEPMSSGVGGGDTETRGSGEPSAPEVAENGGAPPEAAPSPASMSTSDGEDGGVTEMSGSGEPSAPEIVENGGAPPGAAPSPASMSTSDGEDGGVTEMSGSREPSAPEIVENGGAPPEAAPSPTSTSDGEDGGVREMRGSGERSAPETVGNGEAPLEAAPSPASMSTSDGEDGGVTERRGSEEPSTPEAVEKGGAQPDRSRPSSSPVDRGEPASSEAGSAGSGWSLQVGSFRNIHNAARLHDRLREAGYSVHIRQTSVLGKDIYRVLIGPARTRDAAGKLAVEIKARMQIESHLVRDRQEQDGHGQ